MMAKKGVVVAEPAIRLDKHGWEILDPQPVAMPAGFKRPETLAEQVARLVKSERLRQMADEADADTFDEANDFDVDDDFDPTTPYEVIFDPILNREVAPAEFLKNEREFEKRYRDAQAEYFKKVDEDGAIARNLYRSSYRAEQSGSVAAKPAPNGDKVSDEKPQP